MPFPSGATPPPAQQNSAQNPSTPPPPPAGTAPPPPAAAAVNLPDMHVVQNGQTSPAPIPGTQLADAPEDTQVYHEGQWTTLGAVRASLGLPPHIPPAAPPPPPAAVGAGACAPPPAPTQMGFGSGTGTYQTPHQQQSQQGGSPFVGVENAEVGFKRLPYLQGHDQGYQYILRVLEIKYVKGRQSDNVFVEAEVLASSYDADNPVSHQANIEGSKVSLGIKKNDSFLSNMKELAIALTPPDANGQWRSDQDIVSQQELDELTSDAQPAKGRLMRVTATNIITSRGNPFTRYNFFGCVQDQQGNFIYQ